MRPVVLAALLVAALGSGRGDAATTPAMFQPLPFGPGERLTYVAEVGRLGRIGEATMWVEGPVELRGQRAYHLRFEIDTRVGPVRVRNSSESWVVAVDGGLTSMRFHKRERHPLSRREELVEIYPGDQRWERGDGASGRTPSEVPLDELAFIYFLRTEPFENGGAMRYDRHFDAVRNPTLVRFLGRERLVTPAGTFSTLLVEMRVRDGRVNGGEATIRVHFSDDSRRLPVRIESSIPVAGRVVLSLDAFTEGEGGISPT